MLCILYVIYYIYILHVIYIICYIYILCDIYFMLYVLYVIYIICTLYLRSTHSPKVNVLSQSTASISRLISLQHEVGIVRLLTTVAPLDVRVEMVLLQASVRDQSVPFLTPQQLNYRTSYERMDAQKDLIVVRISNFKSNQFYQFFYCCETPLNQQLYRCPK